MNRADRGWRGSLPADWARRLLCRLMPERAWPRLRRLLNAGFVLLALGLLAVQLRTLDTAQVAAALGGFPAQALAAGALFSALSYAAYCGFDLLGRRYTRHALGTRRVLALGFVSHAFALNLGAAGVGLRFRAYGRAGVKAGTVARLWLVCFVSNWLGFLVLAGTLLALQLGVVPPGMAVSAGVLQATGCAFLGVALAYLALCGLSPVRSWTLFGQTVRLPSLRFAVAQCALSVLQWSLIAAALFALLQGAAPFVTVLGVLLVCAAALAVVDVPAGLGVTEAVFVTLLGAQLGVAAVVSALLVYRLVYYLGPLLVAGLAYVNLELRPAAPRPAGPPAG